MFGLNIFFYRYKVLVLVMFGVYCIVFNLSSNNKVVW